MGMFCPFVNVQFVRIEKVLPTIPTAMVLFEMVSYVTKQLHRLVEHFPAEFALEAQPEALLGAVGYHPEIQDHFFDLKIPEVWKILRQRRSRVVFGQNVRIFFMVKQLLLMHKISFHWKALRTQTLHFG